MKSVKDSYKSTADEPLSGAYTSGVDGAPAGAGGLTQALRRVGNSVRGVANGDTEDVVQEACARALRAGVSLEAEQWLRTVAKRVAIDKHRRRRETPSGAPSELEQWAPAVPDGDPEDFYIRGERQRAVREAMAALPPRYRKALQAYAEEDSPAAVAHRLGLSATATWTLLSRARSRLKLQLEQAGFVPAMFMNPNGRPRLRTLLAAAAVAATATTAAIVPQLVTPSKDGPSVPKTVNVSTAADDTKASVEETAPVPKVDLPVKAPKAVTDKVEEIVPEDDGVETVLSTKACVGPEDTEIGVEVGVVEDEVPTVAKLLGLVPEPIREPLAKTCAPQTP
jgi:RNA polymerase sigma factor (sigma-70 family)